VCRRSEVVYHASFRHGSGPGRRSMDVRLSYEAAPRGLGEGGEARTGDRMED
jgi:hypothetical protein